jgi:hypothetical protein
MPPIFEAEKSPDLDPVADQPPRVKSSQTPLFLTLVIWALRRPPPGTRATQIGAPSNLPVYRAETATPDKNLFEGGPCTPTLGAFAGPLPAYVGSATSSKSGSIAGTLRSQFIASDSASVDFPAETSSRPSLTCARVRERDGVYPI